MERGFEIPIAILDTANPPEVGQFTRLGMDVVVNAVWLALFWAKGDKNEEAESALRKLILDWPMDFIFIKGERTEEQQETMFKWNVDMSAKAHRCSSTDRA